MGSADDFGSSLFKKKEAKGLGVTTNLDQKEAFGLGVNTNLAQAVASGSSSTNVDRLTVDIRPERWNEVHNYYFAVVEADKDGRTSNVIRPKSGGGVTGESSLNPDFEFSTKFVSLNIPPSALNVSVQFASSVVATNRGILEENNGVVFRMIQISGTTGVWSGRRTDKQPSSSSSSFNLSQIFPGAVEAVKNLKKVANGALGDNPNLDAKRETLPSSDLEDTGYNQFWQLNNLFLEYSNNKKKRGAGSLRLIFGAPKDNITYVVTPVSFDLRRDSSSPLQYKYSISLKCWDISSAFSFNSAALEFVPDKDKPFSIQSLLERIRKVRNAVNAASNVIKAVQSDVNEILQTINQVVLVAKDIVGVERDLLDFGPTLKQNINSMIESNKAQWAQVLNAKGSHGPLQQLFLEGGTGGLGKAIGSKGSTLLAGSAIGVTPEVAVTLGLDSTKVVNASPSGQKSTKDLSDVAGFKVINDYLDSPDAETTPLSKLGTLPASLKAAIQDQVQKSATITAKDIGTLTTKLKQVSESIAYAKGMMDPTYAKLFSIPAPTPSTVVPTNEDIILSAQIEDGRDALIGSMATGTVYGEKPDDPYSKANSIFEPNDQMPTPLSAIPVFFQRGSTLDDMSKQYLGDANRAREIAILNQLRAPYVDEEGFNRSVFLASGRTFVVNDGSNLVANQKVTLYGTGIGSTRRTILSINDIGGGQRRVVTDGPSNLDQYTSAKSPYLNARLPGTVGSGDTILIPLGNPVSDALPGRQTPLLQRLTYAEKTFKVDIALDANGDLAVGPDGDFSRAYGYQNAVQALKILLETEQGELEQHRSFGIVTEVGNTTTSLNANLSNSIKNAVVSDPRFQSANATAKLNGTAIEIRVDAQGSNGTGLIPVEFKITT